MAIRQAEAEWNGDLKTGSGRVKVESGLFEGRYSFTSRFEEGAGTNPEELLGAAHAACFSMALSAGLGRAGHTPRRVFTIAKVHLGKVGEGFGLTQIDLETVGEVPGITQIQFEEFAQTAKQGCPISKALAAVPTITLKATLK